MKIILMLFIYMLSLSSNAKTGKVLLMIHSYATDYALTRAQDRGAIMAIKDNSRKEDNWTVKRFYFDSKKIASNELREKVKKIKKIIVEIAPTAIFLTDDFAFKSLYKFIHERNIQLIFSGLNGNPKEYGHKEDHLNISGTLERYNFPNMLMFLKKIKPNIKNLLVVTEDNITGLALLKSFNKQLLKHSIFKEFQKIDIYKKRKFEVLKKRLLSVNPHYTAVFIMSTYSQMDSNGKHVSHDRVDTWINKNTKFVDVGLAIFQVSAGRVMSIASSMEESGYYSMAQLLKSIKLNKNLTDFPIRKFLPLKLTLNHSRAKKIGVEFPFEVLIYANAIESLKNTKEKKND